MPRIHSLHYLLAAQLHTLWRSFREWLKSPIERATEIVGDRQSIQDLLSARPTDRQRIYSLPLTASCHEATRLMLTEGITAVVAGSSGLVTTTDMLSKVLLAGKDPRSTTLSEVATPLDRCAYIFAENDVESALSIMAAAGVHHLPVLSDLHTHGGRIVAVVSLQELSGLNRTLKEKRLAAATTENWTKGLSPLSALSTLLSSRETPSSLSSSSSPSSSLGGSMDSSPSSTTSVTAASTRQTQDASSDVAATRREATTKTRTTITAAPVSSWAVAQSITDEARRQAEEDLEQQGLRGPVHIAAAATGTAERRSGRPPAAPSMPA